MLYPEGLMHKKVNIGLALIILTIITGIFAWVISARAIRSSAGMPQIAILVNSPPIPCFPDPPPNSSTCLASCGTCGALAGICAGMFEVQATYWQGTNLLMQGRSGSALCLQPPATPERAAPNPTFTPGSWCIGRITFGARGHELFNFGCSF